MECNRKRNSTRCNCTYSPCPRKGVCCECVAYHLKARELPACFFSADAEATFDRSYENFAGLVTQGKCGA